MKKYFSLIISLFSLNAVSQISDFKYQRKIENTGSTWQKIILPEELFSKIKPNISDIRIYGMSEIDTIEIPYIVRVHENETSVEQLENKIINQTQKDGKYYFTIKQNHSGEIDQINLNFSNSNFSWKANIEGSQNQTNWFELDKNQPLISVENDLTHYRFTTLHFPDAEYKYFRVSIDASEKPDLLSADVLSTTFKKGIYRTSHFSNSQFSSEVKNKLSFHTVKLPNKIPVSSIQIFAKKETDFYRVVDISVLTDSIKTPTGYRSVFTHVYGGTISSFEESSFSFSTVLTQELKFEIRNNDNQPLEIDSILVLSPVYDLTARFSGKRNYVLKYGNEKTGVPIYDIDVFQKQIPEKIESVSLLEEENLSEEKQSLLLPIFKSKTTLWVVLVAVVILVGFFAVKMILGNENPEIKK